jgi:hypothetical protein
MNLPDVDLQAEREKYLKRKQPNRHKGIPRGPRPPDWVNPMKGRFGPRPTLEQRFFEKVDKHGPEFEDKGRCWVWTGAKRPYGYGNFWFRGGNAQAHHVSLHLVGVEVPLGLCVDHLCRRPECVNPAHLRVVTYKINGTENNASPLAVNAKRTHCSKCSTPLTDEHIAVRRCVGPKGTKLLTRICLVCYPHYWQYAVIERPRPANARPRSKWKGPQSWDASHPVRNAP